MSKKNEHTELFIENLVIIEIDLSMINVSIFESILIKLEIKNSI